MFWWSSSFSSISPENDFYTPNIQRSLSSSKFLSHLTLKRNRIDYRILQNKRSSYRYDPKLESEEEIAPELRQAIQESSYGSEFIGDIVTVRSSLYSQNKSKNLEWVLLIANCILELPSAVFDQLSSKKHPHYALTVMLISFIALMTCIGEFIYKGKKKRVILQWRDKVPWFYCPRTAKPLGTLWETIGFACSFSQCIPAAINYSFISRHINGPIKISALPIIFAFGLLCSKYLEKRNASKGNTSQHGDSYNDHLVQVVIQQ